MVSHSAVPIVDHSPKRKDVACSSSVDPPNIAIRSVARSPIAINEKLAPSERTKGFSSRHFVRVRIAVNAYRIAAMSGKSAYLLKLSGVGLRISATPTKPKRIEPQPIKPILSPMKSAAKSVMKIGSVYNVTAAIPSARCGRDEAYAAKESVIVRLRSATQP